jgi:hypothetical protein
LDSAKLKKTHRLEESMHKLIFGRNLIDPLVQLSILHGVHQFETTAFRVRNYSGCSCLSRARVVNK